MTSWPSLRAAYGPSMLPSPGRLSGWSRSTPHLVQIGVDLSSSAGTVLSEEVQSRCAATQQLLGQLSSDLDPYPPDLIIIVGYLVDAIGHRGWQRGSRKLSKPDQLAHLGDR